MSVSAQIAMQCFPAIASMSLGRAWAGHSLESKLSAAASQGIKGIEVFYEDLEHLADSSPPGLCDQTLLQAATEVRRMCDCYALTLISLQPFMHYEGLTNPSEHQARLRKARLWFELAHLLVVDIIQVPSNFLQAGTTGNTDTIVSDLQELADLGATQKPPIRFAYENVCWGTHINKWRQLWEVVQKVNRPNFGICLDVFHLAGSEWAAPDKVSGQQHEESDEQFENSMREMVRTIDVSKIYYVQLADAAKPSQPIEPGHELWFGNGPARLVWSRNMRVFPFEKTGYLPVLTAINAILLPPPLGLGYRGWVSLELFSTTMAQKGETVPLEHATRAMQSWKALVAHFRQDLTSSFTFLPGFACTKQRL